MTQRTDGASRAAGGQTAQREDTDMLSSSTRPTTIGAAPADLPLFAASPVLARLAHSLCEAALGLAAGAQSAALYLTDGLHCALAPCEATSAWGTLPLTDNLAQRALAAEEPLLLVAPEEVGRLWNPSLPARLLLTPLRAAGAPVGVLALALERDACPEGCDALRGWAVGAAAAVSATLDAYPAVTPMCHSMVEWLAQGVVVLDGARRVHYVNPTLSALLRMSAWTPGTLLALEDDACPAALRTLVDPSGGAIMGPYTIAIDDAGGHPLTLQVLPSDLRATGWQARVVLDVSADRAGAEGRAQFISQVAHELRTPLQHIMGFASILSDIEELPVEAVHRFLGHITDESRRLARLVDDLAELSRIENGRFAVTKKPLQVDSLLRDLVARLSPGAQAKQITLMYEGTEAGVWALSDQMRLEQVLTNLVENAIKFVEPEGRITLLMEVSETHLLIGVRDTGPGIPHAALRRVFERYYQVPRSDGQPSRGMGLGLFISREIVHGLGGEIWVSSELGKGSTFSIRIPRR